MTRSPSRLHRNTPTPRVSPPEPRGWAQGVPAEVAQRTGLPAFGSLHPATEVPGTRPAGPSLWLAGGGRAVRGGQEGAVLGQLLAEAWPEPSLACRRDRRCPSATVIFSPGSRGTEAAAPSPRTDLARPCKALQLRPPNPEGEGRPLSAGLGWSSPQRGHRVQPREGLLQVTWPGFPDQGSGWRALMAGSRHTWATPQAVGRAC